MRLWAWYGAWTVADVTTTLYLARVAPHGGELNPLVNALAPHVGFDVAVAVAAAATTVALWLMTLHPFLAIAARAIMFTRPVPVANNLLVIATGAGLADWLIATGLHPLVAQVLIVAAAVSVPVVYNMRKRLTLRQRLRNTKRVCVMF